jgi:hypothetical protein
MFAFGCKVHDDAAEFLDENKQQLVLGIIKTGHTFETHA